MPLEKRLIDTASGGTIEDKIPKAIRELISIVVATSKQYREQKEPLRKVAKVSISSLESKISKLTYVVQSLALGNMQQVKALGICTTLGHPMDMVLRYKRMNNTSM